MMKAIYQGQVYVIGDNLNACELLDERTYTLVQTVDYGANTLIVDPTDAQLEAARAGDFIPPESCAICHENPHFEDEWRYWTQDGYGVCEPCGRKRQVNNRGKETVVERLQTKIEPTSRTDQHFKRPADAP